VKSPISKSETDNFVHNILYSIYPTNFAISNVMVKREKVLIIIDNCLTIPKSFLLHLY